MEALLYWTIWIALALFVLGEVFKPRARAGLPGGRLAWVISAAGIVIAIAHVVLAMDVRHGWSHAAAVAATARQTEAVYGLDWGGGYVANYLFVAAWAAELIAWRMAPARYLAWSGWGRVVLRAFYLVMIANAAVVFAGGMRRLAGAALLVVLVASWSRRRT